MEKYIEVWGGILTSVEFIARLQASNRIQVPVEIRWRFKLEPSLIMRVGVEDEEKECEGSFYARLQRGGRFVVPWEVAEGMGLERGDMVWVTLWIEPKK